MAFKFEFDICFYIYIVTLNHFANIHIDTLGNYDVLNVNIHTKVSIFLDRFHILCFILASPQLTINADPNHLLLGGIGALGAGLLVNHALGDPVGGAIKDHLGKPKGQRRPPPQSNVEHIHHHHVARPEYEEGMSNILVTYKCINIVVLCKSLYCDISFSLYV